MSSPSKILIVEDDIQMAKFIKFKLDYLGYDVVGVAESRIKAVQFAKEFRPDLILMDILLEGGDDGITTATEILSFSDSPIVFLTANENEEFFKRAQITKPFGYLVKPFNDRELQIVIESAVQVHRQKLELISAIEDAQNIINSSPDMIICVGNQNQITEFNRVAEKNLGLNRQDVLGEPIKNLMMNPDDLSLIDGKLERGKRSLVEIQFRSKPDSELSGEVSVSILRDAHQNAIGKLLVSR